MAVPCKAGCGNASWNGQPDDFCSVACKNNFYQNQAPAFQGQPPMAAPQQFNQQAQAFPPQAAYAAAPGQAVYPVQQQVPYQQAPPAQPWQPQQQLPVQVAPAAPASQCARVGCTKPSWNGKANEYCSRSCRNPQQQQFQGFQPQPQGAPQWFLAVDGDVETHESMWKPCLQLDPHHQAAAGAQGQRVQVNQALTPEVKTPCVVNFDLFVAEFAKPPGVMQITKRMDEYVCVRPGCGRVAFQNIPWKFCGKGCEAKGPICLPIKCVGLDGNRSHPPKDQPHPWYIHQVKEREEARIAAQIQAGASQDWLTNDFFWLAFSEAYALDGGKRPDFPAHELFDFRFNEDYRFEREPYTSRRGGALYREPRGWKRFAINTRTKYEDTAWLNDWAVAYHGCPMKTVPLIMKSEFRAGPLQGAKDCLDCRTGEKVGTGLYCSPNTIVNECYSNGEEGANKGAACTLRCPDGKQRTLFFALQCRINPEKIRRPIRTFAKCNDEEVMGVGGVFEWVINSPADIRPYAVMVRDKEGSEHRGLKDLVENWNKEHKPVPPGDPLVPPLLPTQLADQTLLAQVQRSRATAEAALA